MSIDIVVTAIRAPPIMNTREGMSPMLRDILGRAKIPAPKAVAIRAKIEPRREPEPRGEKALAAKFGSKGNYGKALLLVKSGIISSSQSSSTIDVVVSLFVSLGIWRVSDGNRSESNSLDILLSIFWSSSSSLKDFLTDIVQNGLYG